MIPVLGVPVLNQAELLIPLFDSIDVVCERAIIVDNGMLLDLTQEQKLADVIQPGHNLGVAASWNLVMRVTPQAPWWFFANHDITFGPGDLTRLVETVRPDQAAIYLMFGYAAFAITAPALDRIGYFDENFYPAYDEDVDIDRRSDLAGVPRIETGFTGTHVGSATIMSNPHFRMRNAYTHHANDVYYIQKWGGPKYGGETYSTPFNRGGHIGDWRLEAERLRSQDWER